LSNIGRGIVDERKNNIETGHLAFKMTSLFYTASQQKTGVLLVSVLGEGVRPGVILIFKVYIVFATVWKKLKWHKQ